MEVSQLQPTQPLIFQLLLTILTATLYMIRQVSRSYLGYVDSQLLWQLDSFPISHMLKNLLNLGQRRRCDSYAQAPAAQGVYHLQEHS